MFLNNKLLRLAIIALFALGMPRLKAMQSSGLDKNAKILIAKYMNLLNNKEYNSVDKLESELSCLDLLEDNEIAIIDGTKIKITLSNSKNIPYDYKVSDDGKYVQIPFVDTCKLNGEKFLAKIQSCTPMQKRGLSLALFNKLYKFSCKDPSHPPLMAIMELCLHTISDPLLFYSYKLGENHNPMLDKKGKKVYLFDIIKKNEYYKNQNEKIWQRIVLIQESIFETIPKYKKSLPILFPNGKIMTLEDYISNERELRKDFSKSGKYKNTTTSTKSFKSRKNKKKSKKRRKKRR